MQSVWKTGYHPSGGNLVWGTYQTFEPAPHRPGIAPPKPMDEKDINHLLWGGAIALRIAVGILTPFIPTIIASATEFII